MISPKDCCFSSFSFSSSSSVQQWVYDVFLNFRGKDTRNNFIAHLYDALCQKGINTYLDNHLRIGEEISETLFKAIEGSSIAIIVLSKNYAQSHWYLNELIKILECKEKNQQIVVPIFYNVKPSEVRNQIGSVGQALAKLEAKFKDDVKLETWKRALTNVANLRGYHLQNRNESIFIQEIIQELELRIKSCVPQVISLPKVRMEDQVSARTIWAGSKTEICRERDKPCTGDTWHPKCFRCLECNGQIIERESYWCGNRPYHESCFKAECHARCYVCKNFIPENSEGLVEFRFHLFWQKKYCPAHEDDGTPRCYSCDRMVPRDMSYLSLDGGRKQCLECQDSAIMDTHECQPLSLEIQEYYEGLNMKMEQQIKVHFVERQALNVATEGEKKNGHNNMPGWVILYFEHNYQNLTMPRFGYQLIDIETKPCGPIRRCEVIAILVLYGLPRLLTGSILAYEMMRAWLRLKGYNNLRPEVEEGVCMVLAHMWLDSMTYPTSGSSVASSSSPSSSLALASSSSPPSSTSSKGQLTDFEKKLGEYYQHEIESNTSTYGDGFRLGNQAVRKYGLRATLDHIRTRGSFPD